MMDKKRQIQYYAKIRSALQTLFDSDSDHFIDVNDFKDPEALNDFIHCLATRAPQFVFVKITGNELDSLEFNHVANRLILMDARGDK
jgi:hypothetical protein